MFHIYVVFLFIYILYVYKRFQKVTRSIYNYASLSYLKVIYVYYGLCFDFVLKLFMLPSLTGTGGRSSGYETIRTSIGLS